MRRCRTPGQISEPKDQKSGLILKDARCPAKMCQHLLCSKWTEWWPSPSMTDYSGKSNRGLLQQANNNKQVLSLEIFLQFQVFWIVLCMLGNLTVGLIC
jgi:hypothetical protein